MFFSIITATYNSLKTLQETYASLKEQTETSWQWIVIDGDSMDGTQTWLKNLDEPNLVWISEKDKGIYDALNKGVKLARGEVIGFLHSDDLFYNSDVLSNIKRTLFNTTLDGVYGNLLYFRESKEIPNRTWISSAFEYKKLRWGWMPPHPTMFLKRNVYLLAGLFDTSYKIAADYDFILRIFKNQQFKLQFENQFIICMRYGGVSSNWRNQLKKSREDYKVLVNNRFTFPVLILLAKILRKTVQFKSK
jgi:glycosyltransferase involved in cell wall biosynthesis